MCEKQKEIMDSLFESYNNGMEYYSIKMPPSNKIHSLNMALNDLNKSGYIEFLLRNMTEIRITITEKGLELFL